MARYWRGLLAHTVAGTLIGILLVHPVTKAIYGPEWTTGTSVVDRLMQAFAPRMLSMSAAFAGLGAVLGFLFGLYDRMAARQRRALDFLRAELERSVPALIAAGESEHVEFKASARWDLERQCVNRSIEDVIARAVAGFLNHAGGSLLIGVTDTGDVSGLERDYQSLKDRNRDGFERFVIGLVRSRLGGDACPLVHVTFHTLQGRDICRVIVEPATSPAYYHDGNTFRLFVRAGNSTRELDVREAVRHVARRFPSASRATRARPPRGRTAMATRTEGSESEATSP